MGTMLRSRSRAAAVVTGAHVGAAAAVAAAAVLAATALAGCASGATDASSHADDATGHPVVPVVSQIQHTVTHTVHTYRADGTLSVPVAHTVRGSCFTATIAAAGSDAYRCVTATNMLLDPCVAKPDVAHPEVVACRTDPWSAATVIRLTSPLPKTAPTSSTASTGGVTRPWAIGLGDGSRCVAVTGTVPRSHGVSMTYSCTDGGFASTPRPGTHGVMRAAHLSDGGAFTRAATVTDVWQI